MADVFKPPITYTDRQVNTRHIDSLTDTDGCTGSGNTGVTVGWKGGAWPICVSTQL